MYFYQVLSTKFCFSPVCIAGKGLSTLMTELSLYLKNTDTLSSSSSPSKLFVLTQFLNNTLKNWERKGEPKTLAAFLIFCFLKLDFSFGEHHLKSLWLIWLLYEVGHSISPRNVCVSPNLLLDNIWCHRRIAVWI